jgi:hypothetical protein
MSGRDCYSLVFEKGGLEGVGCLWVVEGGWTNRSIHLRRRRSREGR